MAATSVLEPMVTLYRYTGFQEYLAFCYYLTRAWEQPNGPHIISSLVAHGSVFETANAKAYEMLSNLVGLTELYRVTGEPRFLAPINIAWEDITTHRLYISGTSSSAEHFQADGQLPADQKDHVGEGCVTVTWMQLNLELLRLTGESKYGDQLERTIFNQLLAAQNPANGDICYFTPLNGHKDSSPGLSCCVSSEPRGISLIPETVWGDRSDGVAVMQYVSGRATTRAATLESRTDFPATGRVTLIVTPVAASEFTLYLRVPEWTHHFVATVAGKQSVGTPGEFVQIHRKWKAGDQVNIDMDMTVQLLSGGRSYPNSVAIQRGPQVLALESELNPDVAALAKASPKSVIPSELKLRSATLTAPPAREAFAVESKNGPPLILIPFADATDYRVWLSKP